jgi:hypothetical protein
MIGILMLYWSVAMMTKHQVDIKIIVGLLDRMQSGYLPSTGAYNVCRVSADLSTVPESKFMRARAGLNGEEFMVAEFKLEAKFVGGMIDWQFIFDGQSYGSVAVSYDK